MALVVAAVAGGILLLRAADTSRPVAVVGDTQPAQRFQSVGVDAFDRLRGGKDVVVLDVRTPKEYTRGKIPQAMNLDWYSPEFAAKAARLDRSKKYLVYCRSGHRSALACRKLQKLGFTNLVNLKGGIKAWMAHDKPIEP